MVSSISQLRYVQINSVPNGSTGSIMMKGHCDLLAQGCDSFVFWGRGRPAENQRECNFGSKFSFYIDVLMTRLWGRAGFYSKRVTKRLLAKLEELDPDIVHLHNVHGYYLNVQMLFEWLADHRCKVFWTLHDCWTFTGHCAYFTYACCDQWKTGCAACAPCMQLDTYPMTLSKSACVKNYEQKKRIFNLVPADRMTIITPSRWLAELVKESHLGKYTVEVRHNTIDTSVFMPTESSFRESHGLVGKHMILGVALPWTERKGLDDFIRLAGLVDDSYALVLVGLSDEQIRLLPSNVVGLSRTDSKEELAGIYSSADVFFNPTREDNYPTVNLEAEACGTPVVTYDTGGCSETIASSESRVIPNLDAFVDYLKSRWGEFQGEVCGIKSHIKASQPSDF